jgi:predicted aminopeptidase
MQAAAGQWEVVRKREPLAEVVADPETSPELAAKLRLLDEARDFSIAELHLPDNKSYRTYTDLERDYVVWNVFAAPEFSLRPKQWCFPVAGCVSYRGYFKRDAAIRKSESLQRQGFDVAVGGVAAYSTLGNFDDPLLSTMMGWDDVALVAVLFHELAHQVVYVRDDSAFNESFATAVEEFGVSRWLEARAETGLYQDYQDAREYRQRLMALVAAARQDLAVVYKAGKDDETMRQQKSQRLQRLAGEVAAEAEKAGKEPSAWLSGGLNNARLISMTLYEGDLPAFRSLLEQCAQDIRCFYGRARELAALDADGRAKALER